MQAKGTLQRYLQLRSQDLFPNLFTVDKTKQQAPVVQTLDSAIRRINNYPADNIRWIEIYLVDSANQRLNNRGQVSCISYGQWTGKWIGNQENRRLKQVISTLNFYILMSESKIN